MSGWSKVSFYFFTIVLMSMAGIGWGQEDKGGSGAFILVSFEGR